MESIITIKLSAAKLLFGGTFTAFKARKSLEAA